jgi:ketosteroid isomerase-like protein
MAEESTTPDLVARVRQSVRAGSERDIERTLTFYTPDAVWDMSPWGMGIFEGTEAIRGFFEDWLGAYEEYRLEAEEIVDLGNGVVFAVLLQGGRPSGSSGDVQLRYGSVGIWVDALQVRTTNYRDIDEARAAAERLAEERAQADV